MMFMTFHGKAKRPELLKDIHESPKEMTGPLVLLGTLSFFIWYTLPYINPMSTHGWFTDLVVTSDSFVPGSISADEIEAGAHHAHHLAMYLSIGVATLGISLAVLMYLFNIISPKTWKNRFGFLYDWSLNKYYFDENYSKYLYEPTLRLANKISWIDWELYDKYFINGFGRFTDWLSKVSGKLDYNIIDQILVDGTGKVSGLLGLMLKRIQTGRIQNYLLYVTCLLYTSPSPRD